MNVEWTNKDVLTQSETTGQSKAILVINMPKSCADCRLSDFGRCWGTRSYIHMKSYDIPVDCPLKPLPKRKNEYTDIDAMGWNACIDDILGETE